jgi:hypothetical protein
LSKSRNITWTLPGSAIPLINSNILRSALTAKPEGKFIVYENVFGQESNPWKEKPSN